MISLLLWALKLFLVVTRHMKLQIKYLRRQSRTKSTGNVARSSSTVVEDSQNVWSINGAGSSRALGIPRTSLDVQLNMVLREYILVGNYTLYQQDTTFNVPQSSTNVDTRFLTVGELETRRRLLAADRRLFKVLDEQERRGRPCNEVWGRQWSMEVELPDTIDSKRALNRDRGDIGICLSESVVFGPGFYGFEDNPLPVLPRPEANNVGSVDDPGHEERNQVISSEIDRLCDS